MRKRSFFALCMALLVAFVTLPATRAIGADKEITIRYATYLGQEYPEHWPAMMKFIEVVNKKGAGKVKVEFYPSETLLKAKELLSGLMGGAVEAVTVPMVYWHGNLPISQGLSLPFAFDGDLEKFNRAMAKGSPIVKYLNNNFAQKNLYCIFAVCEIHEYLWTKTKAVRYPSDLKGMKIRTSGLIPSEVINRLDAGPVSMASGEVYTSLQRGTVDGILSPTTTVPSRGLQEQLRYVTRYPFDNCGPMIIAFKKDWWDNLSNEVRDVIDEAGTEFYKTYYSTSVQVTKEQNIMLKKNIEFIELTPGETEAFNNMMLPLYDWWVSRKEIGEAGKRLLELMHSTK